MKAWAFRAPLAAAGTVLLVNGTVLMAWGYLDLGTMLPAVLGAFLWAVAVGWTPLARWRQAEAWRGRLWRLGWCCLLLWLVSLGVFWALWRDAGLQPVAVPRVEAVVVLGGGIRDGQPRAALQQRLDTAAALARMQPTALIALCGGAVWGEADTEAQVMARYLEQHHGIAPARMVLEDESTSTHLNLRLVRPLLQARGVGATASLALVTSDFHVPRALRIAQRQGFTAVMPVAAPTPLHTRYNAWLREYFATVSSWALGEG